MQTLNETIKLLHYRLLVLECMTALFIVDCVAKMLLSLYYHKRSRCSVYVEWKRCHLDSLNEFGLGMIKIECMTQNNLAV